VETGAGFLLFYRQLGNSQEIDKVIQYLVGGRGELCLSTAKITIFFLLVSLFPYFMINRRMERSYNLHKGL
jgi:hypothetical protein